MANYSDRSADNLIKLTSVEKATTFIKLVLQNEEGKNVTYAGLMF